MTHRSHCRRHRRRRRRGRRSRHHCDDITTTSGLVLLGHIISRLLLFMMSQLGWSFANSVPIKLSLHQAAHLGTFYGTISSVAHVTRY